MNYLIDLQNVSDKDLPFPEKLLISWAELPLCHQLAKAELTLRFVSIEEMTSLNGTYRKQDKPTNVLAFPASIPAEIQLDYPLLGDVVICPDVLSIESEQQQKALDSHWAHIIIHGVLHLLGFDHIKDSDAAVMKETEVKLLAKLGFANPYQEEEEQQIE
ncbi:rRNA maturation RNase YbeY [Legionella spiritensis]|uniref:Endoribonuclease YbeY n=1 Tax=Legionella spiritensis TaxID=452 RepID=A0A0W0Z4C5_LEGSP|nr:rRNA maturation RNase YbeY [Legionella spiritensis]KTD63993.1 metal-dependent hydrolase [Legionella spiritensis]SNV37047.1 metal-dependent hydrolase [Legionella spiritensis]